jgi:hypothetical protein
MGYSPTVRRAMNALMFAPASEVDLTVRMVGTGFDYYTFVKCTEMGMCFNPLSASKAEIIVGPGSEGNWFGLAHEIGHAAGFFSSTTGVNPMCAEKDHNAPSNSGSSITCIRMWEDQVLSEKRAYDRRKAGEESQTSQDPEKP